MHIIDCKNLRCPQPVINTKKYFDSIEQGEALVIVDNEVAKNNISKFAENNGFSLEVTEEAGLYKVKVIKDSCGCQVMNSDRKLAILITNDKLGLGDDTLGATLMKSYLFALSESDNLPKDLVFLNAGVKLTSEGSECMESLKRLKDKGVNILSCGTCLDFYELKEKLLIGEISNMYTIVEIMNSADNTIKL